MMNVNACRLVAQGLFGVLCGVAVMAGADPAIVILHYGQSNAGITPAGGAVQGAVGAFPGKVLMPNDGRGTHGWRGMVPTNPITGFVPADDHVCGDIQSVVAPAAGALISGLGADAPVVIVRSEAKGGQPLVAGANQVGLHLESDGKTKTSVYRDLIWAATSIVTVARQQGMSVQTLYIPFTHQEADRGKEGAVYLAQLRALMRDVETDLRPLGVPIVWLLDQAGGTTGEGSGNAWPDRLVLQQAADEAENVHLIGPRYPYPIFDAIHWTNRGKILYGELLGTALAEMRKGHPFDAAKVRSVKRVEQVITITFDSQTPLLFDDAPPFPVRHSVRGFTLSGVKNGASIVSAEVSGPREVTIRLDAVPKGEAMRIRYAFRPREKDELGERGWAVGNGTLRETWSVPSRVFPGTMLYRWVPAFEQAI